MQVLLDRVYQYNFHEKLCAREFFDPISPDPVFAWNQMIDRFFDQIIKEI